MRIQFVSAELAPLCQSGGLGDAVSGLARALGALGHDVTCVIPGYRQAFAALASPVQDEGEIKVRFPGFDMSARIKRARLFPRVDVVLLDCPGLYDRAGLYGDHNGSFGDNAFRYLFLSRAAAYFAEATVPDVVVAHDWHTGLVPALLRTTLDRGPVRGIGTVQVVHNNAYQGRIDAANLAYTGLPADLMHKDGLEAWGELCMLKGGVLWADRIVAVSPTYAREIQTGAFGEGLEGAFRSRAHRLTGIVNGIDTTRFDPSTDPALAQRFSTKSFEGKAACRRQLLERLRLKTPAPGLLCAAVGRFAQQKGWDVLTVAVEGLLKIGASLVFVGDGDRDIAQFLEDKRRAYPDRVSVFIGYDDTIARRVYAGADTILVPSRFEPCGLVQLLAQRYGAVPVAHATGGLVDTITDPVHVPALAGADRDDPWRRATGVLFAPLTAQALVDGVSRVAALGAQGRLGEVQKRLAGLDVSWDAPSRDWEISLREVVDEARRRL